MTDHIAAALARVSTSGQGKDEHTSLISQIDHIKAYASANNILLEDRFIFQEVYSGLKLERPTVDALLDALKKHSLNTLIVYSADRYTRNSVFGELLDTELRQYNVELHYVSQGKVDIYSSSGKLFNRIQRDFANYEADLIRERSMRGKQTLLQEGIAVVSGWAPYGYKKVGKKRTATIEIVPEEKPIIEYIFQWAYEGKSIALLQQELAAQGVITRTGIPWSESALYKVLRDECYAGIYHANKFKLIETGSYLRKKTPDHEHIKVSIPAIIDRAMWNEVQRRLDTGRNEKRPLGKYNFLVARRVICDVCKWSMQTRTVNTNKLYTYYACNSKRHGVDCTVSVFSASAVDSAVWNFVKDLILNPDVLKNSLKEAQLLQDQESIKKTQRIQQLQTLLVTSTKELDILVRELRTANTILSSILKKQIDELSTYIERIQQEKEQLEQARTSTIITEDQLEKVYILSEIINPRINSTTFIDKRSIIEMLQLRFALYREDTIPKIHIYLPVGTSTDLVINSAQCLLMRDNYKRLLFSIPVLVDL